MDLFCENNQSITENEQYIVDTTNFCFKVPRVRNFLNFTFSQLIYMCINELEFWEVSKIGSSFRTFQNFRRIRSNQNGTILSLGNFLSPRFWKKAEGGFGKKDLPQMS